MSRKPKQTETEAERVLSDILATKPRPVDDQGRELDGWGLPLSGPARVRALGDKPDPALGGAASVEEVSKETNTTDGAAGDEGD